LSGCDRSDQIRIFTSREDHRSPLSQENPKDRKPHYPTQGTRQRSDKAKKREAKEAPRGVWPTV